MSISSRDTDLSAYELPMIQKKIVQRSCKGPVSIKRIDPKGEYIVIENTCIKKPVVMTNWTLKRRGVDVPSNSFKFEKHFVLHPNKSVKIFAKDKGRNYPPHELMSDTVVNWGTGTYAYTSLVNHLNQERASLLEKIEHYEREVQVSLKKKIDTNQIRERLDELDLDEKFDFSRDFEFYYEKNIRP
ncbi:intermediate filament tail domain [Brachionus plicatilis]|uniref:Intermediate filament tail domain n=1 Tax=Brachionus plicatilis TaxID=10195 RepID=A0A3M7T6Z9_BRAPC|nr:intermediate filament tail domain [Brachionus plicatilis]